MLAGLFEAFFENIRDTVQMLLNPKAMIDGIMGMVTSFNCGDPLTAAFWGCVGAKLLGFITAMLGDIQDRQNKANIFNPTAEQALNLAFGGAYYAGYGVGFLVVNVLLSGGSGAAAGAVKGVGKFAKLKNTISTITDPFSKIGDLASGPAKGIGKTMRGALGDTLGEARKRVGKELQELKEKIFGKCKKRNPLVCDGSCGQVNQHQRLEDAATRLRHANSKAIQAVHDFARTAGFQLSKLSNKALDKLADVIKKIQDEFPIEKFKVEDLFSAKVKAKGSNIKGGKGPGRLKAELEGNAQMGSPGKPKRPDGSDAPKPDYMKLDGNNREFVEGRKFDPAEVTSKQDFTDQFSDRFKAEVDQVNNGWYVDPATGSQPIPANANKGVYFDLEDVKLTGVSPQEAADGVADALRSRGVSGFNVHLKLEGGTFISFFLQ